MRTPDGQLSPAAKAAMLLAIAVTILFGIWLLRVADRMNNAIIVSFSTGHSVDAVALPRLGVNARITAGDVTITRSLPSLAFTIDPDQSLDARLPAGPFAANFDVTFERGSVQQARFGAVLRNSSLIIWRDGELLLADHVGDEQRTVLTTQLISLTRAYEQLTFEYEAVGEGPWMIQAVWQPDLSETAQPLPSAGAQ